MILQGLPTSPKNSGWRAFDGIVLVLLGVVFALVVIVDAAQGGDVIFRQRLVIVLLGIMVVVVLLLFLVSCWRRDESERLFRESEGRYRRITENMIDLVWVMDLSFKPLFYSPSVFQMTGYTASERMDISLEKVLTPASYARIQAGVEGLLKNVVRGKTNHPDNRLLVELEQIRKDGTHYWTETRISLMYDNAGKVVGFQGVTREMGERKKTMEALEAAMKAAQMASRAKEIFCANMNHELQTPLNGVIGMTNLLLETPLDVEQREYTKTIQKSASSLLDMVESILDFSQIEAGNLTLARSEIHLESLVEEVAATYTSQAVAKKLGFTLEFGDEVPRHVLGDPVRVKRVLDIFLNNAVRYTNFGEIGLSVKMLSDDGMKVLLKFEVKDTGIGIPSEKHQSTFRASSQVDSSLSRTNGGAGLGLSIAESILKNYNGNIGLESSAGKGANFWFTIFLEKCPRPVPATDGQYPKSSKDGTFLEGVPATDGQYPKGSKDGTFVEGERPRILVADDNLVNQDVVARLLEKFDCEVVVAGGGADAIRTFQEKPVSLVFIDINVAQEVAESLLKIRQNAILHGEAPVPLVAMVVEPSGKHQELGLDDCIIEPITTEALQKTLSRWVQGLGQGSEVGNFRKETSPKFPEEIIDWQKLVHRLGGDQQSARDILQFFLRDTSPIMETLKMALEKSDQTEVKKLAHSLKGAAGNVEAKKMFRFAKQLWLASSEQRLDDSRALFGDLSESFSEVQKMVLEMKE